MDVVEFVEQTYGAELYEWQKEYLRTLDRLRHQGYIRIVMNKGIGRMFTYFKMKELFPNGTTTNSEQ